MLASFFKITVIISLFTLSSSCAGLGGKTASDEVQAIENPFVGFAATNGNENQNVTLRSKQGDRSVEVELSQDQASEVSVPMAPAATGRHSMNDGSSIEGGIDHYYSTQKATTADREIASTFGNKDDAVTDAKKREIESSLGLQASDESLNMDESYLAKIDMIKQLFKNGRYEASLIEIDHELKLYPTNGRLYEMRGTVLDRLGYLDLALRSWKQALEFEPKRLSLKKMIEKKEQQRSVASERR